METTQTITETVTEILALITARDLVRERLNKDATGNLYLVTVEMDLENSVKDLTSKLRRAIRD